MSALKRCPFCGSDLIEVSTYERTDRPHFRWIAKVVCLECFGQTQTHGFHATPTDAKKEAIRQWNRRYFMTKEGSNDEESPVY